jgi:hypothetical protein
MAPHPSAAAPGFYRASGLVPRPSAVFDTAAKRTLRSQKADIEGESSYASASRSTTAKGFSGSGQFCEHLWI